MFYTAQLGAQNLVCNYNLKLNEPKNVKEILYRLEIKDNNSDFFNNDIVKLNLPEGLGISKKYEVLFKRASKMGVFSRQQSFNIIVPLDEKLKWKISEKDTLIENVHLKIANTMYKERKISALFNADISIPEGPFIFKGLPGLVYQIKCNIYTIQLLDIQTLTVDLAQVEAKPLKTLT